MFTAQLQPPPKYLYAIVIKCVIIQLEILGGIHLEKKISSYGVLQRNIRMKTKLSIRALSEKSGVSHSYLSQVENGTRDTPSPEVIKKISEALSFDYFVLMREAGYMTTQIDSYPLNKDLLTDMLKSISYIEKKEFISRFSRRLYDEVFRLEKNEYNLTTQEVKSILNTMYEDQMEINFLRLEDNEQNTTKFLLTRFEYFAETKDYLSLFRFYKGYSYEYMARRLNIDVEEYKINEENLVSDSPFLKEYGESLAAILEFEDLIQWLKIQEELILTFRKKIKEYGGKSDKIDVIFNYPKFINSEEDGVIYELSEEEAKEQFLYLENLLTMDENIYFNKRLLTSFQKGQLLKMAEIILAESPEVK